MGWQDGPPANPPPKCPPEHSDGSKTHGTVATQLLGWGSLPEILQTDLAIDEGHMLRRSIIVNHG